MTDLYPWWKVVDDLSEDHALNAEQQAKLESELEESVIVALFNGSIRPVNKFGQTISPLLEISKGARDVWVRVSDVNKYFFDVNPKFVWKPRKKQGRPVSHCSLEAHLASGKLKIDAIKAASQLKGNTGRIPHRYQVANRLAQNFPDYSRHKAGYIEKKLRIGWWN